MARWRKKRIPASVVAFILLLGVYGCKGSTTAGSKKIVVDSSVLAEKIVKDGDFDDELNQLENSQFGTIYEEVDASLVKKSCVYIGSGATAEQVVVVEAKDAESAKKVKDQLKEKLEEDRKENEGYLPKEIAKIDQAVLEVKGEYAILVVSKDSKQAEQVIDSECK